MKLMLVDNDGTVIGTIDSIEEYNLDKPMARSSLVDEIKEFLDDAGVKPAPFEEELARLLPDDLEGTEADPLCRTKPVKPGPRVPIKGRKMPRR